VKDVELADQKAHKDIRQFAAWLKRNAQDRLSRRFSGSGPKLVVTLTLDPRGLRDQGGLITARWAGPVALEAAFRAEAGTSVAKAVVAAEIPQGGPFSGFLEPSGDRLLDDLLDFVAAPR
jgi:hypothetical protein